MSVFHNNALAGASGQQGYRISRSLRFNSADSAYLNRTPASAGNRQTWTWSGWIKRANLSSSATFGILEANAGVGDLTAFRFSNDTISLQDYSAGVPYNLVWSTSAVFRDPSSWYHLVLTYDTTQASSANTVKIYINGVQQTVTFTAVQGAYVQNRLSYVNTTVVHRLGVYNGLANYFDGYLTETYLIDGQALTPSSFGETDTITGVWKPKKYAGTYGTNGFYLNFSDNSGTTSTTLGKDSSGNSNNWTPNNFSVTAGAGNDSMIDTPTPYADGGNGRGNYATLNPLSTAATLADGNLDANTSGSIYAVPATILFPDTGKYYAEFSVGTGSSPYPQMGILDMSANFRSNANIATVGKGVIYSADGTLYKDGALQATYSTFTTGDLISVAYDPATRNVWVAKNGTWQNSGNPAAGTGAVATASTATQGYAFACGAYSLGKLYVNFGQRPFAYTPPSGFVALNTQNLPEPSIKKPSAYMDVKLYSGTNASQSITGLGFSPDLIWFKNRTGTAWHALFDSVRGRAAGLSSNVTDAESTSSAGNDLVSFDANGFTLGPVQNWNSTNGSGNSIVAWCWDANGSGSTNTAGTITSTVSANASAGFSIVSFTTNNTAGATVGHGLGVAPAMIIMKYRGLAANWVVYHKNMNATPQNGYLNLNTTAGYAALTDPWNNTAPTSTVITMGAGVGSAGSTNYGTYTSVAYCFSEVAGFSKFGSYSGNSSTDGTFVFCGFRPKYVLIKGTGSGGSGWIVLDSARDTYNAATKDLRPDLSNGEPVSSGAVDFLSNGFKLRNTDTNYNSSSGSYGPYVFAAFSESPFKYSLAR